MKSQHTARVHLLTYVRTGGRKHPDAQPQSAIHFLQLEPCTERRVVGEPELGGVGDAPWKTTGLRCTPEPWSHYLPCQSVRIYM